MKALDKYFDNVYLITLDTESDKSKRSFEYVSQYTDRLEVTVGIRGDDLPPPPGYRAGNGAWGCLQSHVRVAQDAWLKGYSNYLVLEDDVVFVSGFESLLDDFMGALPENWDQVYLGGQHRKTPRWVNEAVFQAGRINRTHCMALRRETIPDFLKHVLDLKDHMEASFPKHIDHRLEDAHEGRYWNTYTPSWWLVGQGENMSDINGRWHPDKWWDYDSGFSNYLPYIVVDREPTEEENKFLHFGWADRLPGYQYLDPFFQKNHREPVKGMRVIARESFECRRLPAVAVFEDESLDWGQFLGAWEGDTNLYLSELDKFDLQHYANYPRNGLFGIKHRWVSP